MEDTKRLHDVIFEYVRVGRMLRMNAIDPVSGTEVTVFGPASVGEGHLKRVAKRKLEYVIAKRRRENSSR